MSASRQPAPSVPNASNIHISTLSNGMRVAVYENFASPTVVIEGCLPGGTIYEAVAAAGLADLTMGMMRRGTRQRSFDEINETVDAVGASFGFDCGRHTFSFSSKSLVEDLDLVLDLLAESLAQPSFADDQLELLRSRILTGIHERQYDTRATASLTFRRLLYPNGHPYGRPISGSEDTVAPLTRDDVTAFYRDHVSPAGGIVVVVGAIAAADAIARLERTLGQWQVNHQRPTPAALQWPQVKHTIRETVTIPGKSQSDIVLGWLGIERKHADYFPVLLCNSILGRFGMGGRLGRNVREKQGMAYYSYSTFQTSFGPGPWMAVAGVNPGNVEQTIAAILTEIEQITQDVVSDEELADVQANLTGSLPLDLETNHGIADNLVAIIWHDLGLDYLVGYADHIRAVNKADILRVAQTYLDPNCYILSIAGPTAIS